MEYPQINGYGGYSGYNSGYNTNGRGVSALYNGAYGYPYNLEDYTAPQRDFKGAWTVSSVFVTLIKISTPINITTGFLRPLAVVGTLLVPETCIW